MRSALLITAAYIGCLLSPILAEGQAEPTYPDVFSETMPLYLVGLGPLGGGRFCQRSRHAAAPLNSVGGAMLTQDPQHVLLVPREPRERAHAGRDARGGCARGG